MRRFLVNGKTYKSKELDFNAMCDLEDMGVSMVDIKSKNMSLIRAYLAFCGNISAEEAGDEIILHLKNGGKFDEIMEELKVAIENSDFFASSKRERKRKMQRARWRKAKKSKIQKLKRTV